MLNEAVAAVRAAEEEAKRLREEADRQAKAIRDEAGQAAAQTVREAQEAARTADRETMQQVEAQAAARRAEREKARGALCVKEQDAGRAHLAEAVQRIREDLCR